MTVVTITRRRDPLEGQRVAVLRRWRRKHGGMDLLVVLPSGRKRLVPQAWTDHQPTDKPQEENLVLGPMRWEGYSSTARSTFTSLVPPPDTGRSILSAHV